MPIIRSNGIQIAYEIHGHGEPLLLIAGVGYGRWFWNKIVPKLAERYQVITFDNRGAGDSDKPEGPYTVEVMAEDTIGLLLGLDIQRAHVFGHSLGGYIAQEIGVSNPEIVNKMVLASTNTGGSQIIPTTPQAMEVLTNRQGDLMELLQRGIQIACAPGFAELYPDLIEELMAYRQTNPVPAAQYQAQIRAGIGMGLLTEEQVRARMMSLSMPVLILFGKQDQVVPPGNAHLMAEKLPNARIEILPGAGHLFPIEAPEATVAAVIDFLG